MLLRIVDKSGPESRTTAAGRHDEPIEIIYENGALRRSHQVRGVRGLFGAGLGEAVAWYLQEYPHQGGTGDRQVPAKLIQLGQRMGDELLGDTHVLEKYMLDIEKTGYAGLEVRIESERPAFFSHPWELLVLPGSKHMLSTLCRAFLRCHPGLEAEPARSLELGLGVTQHDPLAALQGTAPAGSSPAGGELPLRVLHLVARGKDSNIMESWIEALSAEGAIRHRIATAHDAQSLCGEMARLPAVHVLHYHGPVVLHDEEVLLVLGDAEVALGTVLEPALDAGLVLLCVDASAYRDGNGDAIEFSAGLARVAECARTTGLGNVLGLAAKTDVSTRARCFNQIYADLLRGLPLSQAVIEARKALQARIEDQRFSTVPRPFHYWFLPCHYGAGEIVPFAQPQRVGELHDAALLGAVRQRLHGFDTRRFPPLFQAIGDGSLARLVGMLADGNDMVTIHGPRGVGKTLLAHQLAFYLACDSQVEHGFYLDIGDGLAADEILDMVAPVLGLAQDCDTGQVLAALAGRKCCFVFDQYEATSGLSELIGALRAQSHFVVCVAASGSAVVEGGVLEVGNPAPLTLRMVALAALRRCKPKQAPSDDAWLDGLLAQVRMPALIERIVPLLELYDAEALVRETRAALDADTDGGVLAAFQAWRWRELPDIWRDLLLLAYDTEGLLFELPMVSARQGDAGGPYPQLLQCLDLGDTTASFVDALAAWRAGGFIVPNLIGHVLSRDVRAFLDERRAEWRLPAARQEQAALLFSELLLDGLTRLCLNLLKQPNPSVSYHLLFNRRHWVRHIERLWFSGRYQRFMACKSALQQLMDQARLGPEIGAWTLDLLRRSEIAEPGEESPLEACMAWLAMAAAALQSSDGPASEERIHFGAERWQAWLDARPEAPRDADTALVHQAASFLQVFYLNQERWSACVRVNGLLIDMYRHHRAWLRYVQALKVNMRCCSAMNDLARLEEAERMIIDSVPYDEVQPGLKTQQMLDLAFARVARGEPAQAQELVDSVLASGQAGPAADMCNGLQAEIFLLQGRHDEALPLFCRVAERMLAARQDGLPTPLKEKLLEIRARIGRDDFDRIVAKHAPAVAAGLDYPLERQ